MVLGAGGQVDRWAGGQVDRWAGGQVDRWTGGQVDRKAGGQVEVSGVWAAVHYCIRCKCRCRERSTLALFLPNRTVEVTKKIGFF